MFISGRFLTERNRMHREMLELFKEKQMVSLTEKRKVLQAVLGRVPRLAGMRKEDMEQVIQHLKQVNDRD